MYKHLIALPTDHLEGIVSIPGDKSISHRAIMLASLAKGTSVIHGFLNSQDCMTTIDVFKKMGVDIEIDGNTVLIDGVGLHGLKKPKEGFLYFGNSGTGMRLMTGIMAAQSFDSLLVGDESLNLRPMRRILAPLQKMGANIELSNDDTAPIKIKGNQVLKGIKYDLFIASAQVKSSILLAGLYAQGKTKVTSCDVVRDHTCKMLSTFKYPITVHDNMSCVVGGSDLTASTFEIPADFSSSFFFIAAAAITPNSQVKLKRVGINPTRTGALSILKLMGAQIKLSNVSCLGGELIADIEVQYRPLQGINIPKSLISLSIDEFPALLICAVFASGSTLLRSAQELRLKESDRLFAMAQGLLKLGVSVKVFDDGLEIKGIQKISGGEVNSFGDHRIAMAFTVASLRAKKMIKILDCSNINTSFPNFIQLANSLGLKLSIQDIKF